MSRKTKTEKSIFLVVAIGQNGSHSRCFGWFPKLAEARERVERNVCDLNEAGFYSFIVIEESKPGIHADSTNEYWYTWEDGVWSQCAKPEWAIGYSNWVVG